MTKATEIRRMHKESETVVQPGSQDPETRGRNWLPLLALAGFSGLLIFQAFAYYRRLPLSLGPRVILQPWLLQHGFNMYENIADMHSPLMPMILAALVPLIPNGLRLAKLVLVALISITTILTFVTGWRKVGWLGGLWAAWFFVIWSPAFTFNKLWYETFLAPIYLVWLLAYKPSSTPRTVKSLFFFGLLGGVSALIKQQAALVFLAFALWQAFTSWYFQRSISNILRELIVMILGAITPVLMYLIYQYAHTATLVSFLYWTVGYQFTGVYKTFATIYPTLPEIRDMMSCYLLVPVAIVCAIDLKHRGNESWLNFGLGILLLATGAVTAYPRFEFFHLQAILPVVALVSSMTLAYALHSQNSGWYFALGITIALSAFWFVTKGTYYRPVITVNQQPEIYEYSDLLPLAQEIRPYIGATGCVYIFPNDEANANLYYLLHCTPPKFWIFHYPWYMLDWTKTKILLTLEQDQPEWIAYFPNRWDAELYAPEIVANFQDHYSHVASFQWAQGEVQLLKHLP